MEHLLGEGWTVLPAGGATGEAYFAKQGEQTVFLKRNSSPFLAVLSAEGIVPKLLWTKRLENGDVITAQRWVHGRELKAHEMREKRVAALLAKIHQSNELLEMFLRIGNEPLTPAAIVADLYEQFKRFRHPNPTLESALAYLKAKVADVTHDEMTVCHCDINHNNWIVDENGQLYLIDWDGATISDPALDLGVLLYTYVPEEDWKEWLHHYGIELEPSLRERMDWYVLSQIVSAILSHDRRHEAEQVKKLESELRAFLRKIKSSPINDR